ncbi:hypothetical protein BDA99DRAFT_528115 [Phascolomyces articulosus]|uniref:Uncharacterized protein n=1 Tax=Phascolomyces articulosus TaxID=60185 RepID=A0AAD5JM78_9FUNG|nr:hypothetical protein BDA99DRAFT_528115 [Phascolomyces articulosus]
MINTITSSPPSTPIAPTTEKNKDFFSSTITTTTINSNHIDRHYSIQDNNGAILATASEYLSSASIAQWLQQCPTASATLTLEGGDTIDLPVYALRRRNAVVANLPDSPSYMAA